MKALKWLDLETGSAYRVEIFWVWIIFLGNYVGPPIPSRKLSLGEGLKGPLPLEMVDTTCGWSHKAELPPTSLGGRITGRFLLGPTVIDKKISKVLGKTLGLTRWKNSRIWTKI